MRRAHALVALLVLLGACTTDPGSADRRATDIPSDAAVPGDLPRFGLELTSPDGSGTATFLVWDAATDAARARGLMHLEELPADEGMLFRFAEPRVGGFWMKDTLIPLSIAFADGKGVIHQILDMEPCRAEPCPIYTPRAPYRYALEVNQGAFADAGVVQGWVLGVPEGLSAPK